MAYGVELREKVLKAYENGEGSQQEIATIFEISVSTFKCWLSKIRNGKSLLPLTDKNSRPVKIDTKGEAFLRKLVAENPSITLGQLSELYYTKHKVVVGRSILSRTLQRLHLRYKKRSVISAEKQTEAIKKKE